MILLNGVEVKPTIFPDKTSQVWKLSPGMEYYRNRHVLIVWEFEGEREFMQLAQLKMLLNTQNAKADLFLTYLPYGRQDKPVRNDATFGLATFAELLNCLGFECVTCDDPHSDVAAHLIKNFKAIYPDMQMLKAYKDTGSQLVCYPDAGALQKYTKVLGRFKLPFIFGEKHRDQATGKITDYRLRGDDLISGVSIDERFVGRTVLIIDDICDGGATFIGLCDLLKLNGAGDVHLFVSHGIFSRGTMVLREAGISRIFTKEGEITNDSCHSI